ncbi:hypothetical protein A4G19_05690 [Pasteurellaceae bacterium Macca]|nr:hypothetical protein [Pasteurellaceae bacterium Macca]
MLFQRIQRPLFALMALCSPLAWGTEHCITYQQEGSVHISKIDLNCPNLELIGSEKSDNGLSVSAFAQKYHAEVAINANFYWKDFTPIGLVMHNHKRWSKYGDTKARTIFACDKQNRCLIEDKGKVTPVNGKWRFALSGWQWFNAKSGKFECAVGDNIGCRQDIFTAKHPRTLLGLDEKNNWLYLVVVEGRQFTARGMNLDELAELASRLGLTKAINLDGGGSAVMVRKGQRVSALPLFQGDERQIANHFGVKMK